LGDEDIGQIDARVGEGQLSHLTMVRARFRSPSCET
jgi:hypothetical protein